MHLGLRVMYGMLFRFLVICGCCERWGSRLDALAVACSWCSQYSAAFIGVIGCFAFLLARGGERS